VGARSAEDMASSTDVARAPGPDSNPAPRAHHSILPAANGSNRKCRRSGKILLESANLGGKKGDPRWQQAIDKIVAAGKKHGKVLGQPAGSPKEVKQYMEEVFLFFQGPSELGLLRGGARELLDPLGKKGFDPKTKTLY